MENKKKNMIPMFCIIGALLAIGISWVIAFFAGSEYSQVVFLVWQPLIIVFFVIVGIVASSKQNPKK